MMGYWFSIISILLKQQKGYEIAKHVMCRRLKENKRVQNVYWLIKLIDLQHNFQHSILHNHHDSESFKLWLNIMSWCKQ